MHRVGLIIPMCNTGEHQAKRQWNIDYVSKHFYFDLCYNDIQIIPIYAEQRIDKKLKLFSIRLALGSAGCTYTLNGSVFNKAWLYNCAIRAFYKDIDSIILSEMDVFSDKTSLCKIIAEALVHKLYWCHLWSEIIYLSQETSGIVPDHLQINYQRDTAYGLDYSGRGAQGGMVWFDKAFFMSIGGMNEWIQQMGGEDNEIIARADYAYKNNMKFYNKIYHLWHPRSSMKMIGPIRKRNSEIYKYTKEYPLKVINYLSQQNFGNPHGPLCTQPYLI